MGLGVAPQALTVTLGKTQDNGRGTSYYAADSWIICVEGGCLLGSAINTDKIVIVGSLSEKTNTVISNLNRN